MGWRRDVWMTRARRGALHIAASRRASTERLSAACGARRTSCAEDVRSQHDEASAVGNCPAFWPISARTGFLRTRPCPPPRTGSPPRRREHSNRRNRSLDCSAIFRQMAAHDAWLARADESVVYADSESASNDGGDLKNSAASSCSPRCRRRSRILVVRSSSTAAAILVVFVLVRLQAGAFLQTSAPSCRSAGGGHSAPPRRGRRSPRSAARLRDARARFTVSIGRRSPPAASPRS